ncbi:MAG TPA: hypothetical protein PKG60_11275 [Spirochaetota bacterium]|nr:hypothetical protein [Spirochaetota bacterium]HPS86240.1 hypothetical protein [Spirochaetota bacterium]
MKNKKYFFIIFSAASFISALMFYYNSRTFLSNSAEAEAVIVQNNEISGQYPGNNTVSNLKNNIYAIEFFTADGRRIKSTIKLSSENLRMTGDRISILYNKNNPESVSVRYSWKVLYFLKAILLFCLSVIFDITAFKIK